MAGLLDLFPLQVRTLAQSIGGDTSPITEKNLDDAERQKIANAILASRSYKQGLLDLKNQNSLNDWQATDYKRYFPNENAIKSFKSGAGAVNYDDYMNASQGTSDWNMLPSGGVRNTLGQFRYATDKNGNTIVTDRYDFTGDKVDNLPDVVANTHRYEKMSTPQKAWTVAKETFVMPQVGFSPKLGFESFPSRFGNAFVGNSGRNVNITLPKSYQINPTPEDLYYTRLSLMK